MSRFVPRAGLLLLAMAVLPWQAAEALPSFARQTGEECGACHVGRFGPQLTAHGRQFKLTGYTDGNVGKWLPLSGMAVTSFTHTRRDQPAANGAPANNRAALDEASLFYAGRIAGPVGAFIQVTHDGVGHSTALDNLDVRAAHTFALKDKDVVVGASFNNNPTASDLFNSTPAWGLPFTGSPYQPEANAGTLLGGGVEMQVLGASLYADWDQRLYAEVGAYGSPSAQLLHRVGIAREAVLDGAMPYWRVAYTQPFGRQEATLGLFGSHARLHAEGDPAAATDRVTDIGIDGSYLVHLGHGDVLTVNARRIHERQRKDGSFALELAADPRGSLDETQLDASWFHGAYGLTAGLFRTGGSADSGLYPQEDVTGSRLGRPGTRGYRVEADWTPFGAEDSWHAPWANLRMGLQYTAYQRFNGASDNYDGAGRKASDNDTLFLSAWLAF